MTEKASPAGWVVQVTVTSPLDAPTMVGARWIGSPVPSAPSFQYFNVALAAPSEALAATAKHLAKSEIKDGELSVVRGLSSEEIASLDSQGWGGESRLTK